MLEVKNLRKTFKLSNKQQKIERTKEKIKVAVSDVSFKADNGQILGILGANGAGKTTTLRMLATVIKPENGQILFNGEDIYSDIDGYRAKIGFLTSELKLEDFFTPDYLEDFEDDFEDDYDDDFFEDEEDEEEPAKLAEKKEEE